VQDLIGLNKQMNENKNKKEQWFVFEVKNDDLAVVHRLRADKPLNKDIKKFDQLIIISWKYEANEVGFPFKEDQEEINEFEQAIDELTCDKDLSYLMLVKTGKGLREWVFYVKDVGNFVQQFNKLLLGRKAFPIEVTRYVDKNWDCWQENGMGLAMDKPTEEKFWKWFKKNQEMLFNCDSALEAVFDKLRPQIKKINQDLTFEFGPIRDGKREFIISANGIRKAFRSVISLAESAPELKRFTVVTFRQRKDINFVLTYKGATVSFNDVLFSIESDEHAVNISLYIRGNREDVEEIYVGIGFLVLDSILGEFDVITKVNSVSFLPYEAECGLEKYPIDQLPSMFDSFFQEIEA